MEVSVASLWMPILVSAVIVFVASFLAWMVLPHHKQDYPELPDEEKIMDAMRAAGVQPGQYAFPNCGGDMKAMSTPEFQEKMKKGPCGFVYVGPSGPPNMGKSLGQWFVYCLFIGALVAYLTGLTHAPGTDYMVIFRFAGTAATVAYCTALIPTAIWKHASWSMIGKEMIDGFVYGLLVGGTFGWLWPGLA